MRRSAAGRGSRSTIRCSRADIAPRSTPSTAAPAFPADSRSTSSRCRPAARLLAIRKRARRRQRLGRRCAGGSGRHHRNGGGRRARPICRSRCRRRVAQRQSCRARPRRRPLCVLRAPAAAAACGSSTGQRVRARRRARKARIVRQHVDRSAPAFSCRRREHTLAAEGLPFVFRHFTALGEFASIEALFAGEKWLPASWLVPPRQTRPTPNAVISFP